MTKTIFLILYLTLLMTLISCDYKLNQAPCGYELSWQGERITQHKLPLTIYAHESFPQEYIPSLMYAISIWNNKAKKPLFVFGGMDRGPLNPREDRKTVVYWYTNTWPLAPIAQAVTTKSNTGDEITNTDILVNNWSFQYFTNDSFSNLDIHLESLLIHELGHTLGMVHRDAPSVMSPILAPGEIRTVFSKEDIETITCGGY